MFYSIEEYPFLKEVLASKNVIYQEYIKYKSDIKSLPKFNIQKEHLNNLENYNLITSFGMCVYSIHEEGEGQVTNGLFNFNYTMPDRNFVKLKPFLEKKFNINYKYENKDGPLYFEKTLSCIKKIPNLVQCGFGEFKPTCVFEPHKHEKVMVYHILLNNDDNEMIIECNKAKTSLCIKSPYVIFKGNDTHSAILSGKSNMITFVSSFNY